MKKILILIMGILIIQGCKSREQKYLKALDKLHNSYPEYFHKQDTIIKFVDKGLKLDSTIVKEIIVEKEVYTEIFDTIYIDSVSTIFNYRTVFDFKDSILIRDSFQIKIQEPDKETSIEVPQTIIKKPKRIRVLEELLVILLGLAFFVTFIVWIMRKIKL